jgi:hypothetical protein
MCGFVCVNKHMVALGQCRSLNLQDTHVLYVCVCVCVCVCVIPVRVAGWAGSFATIKGIVFLIAAHNVCKKVCSWSWRTRVPRISFLPLVLRLSVSRTMHGIDTEVSPQARLGLQLSSHRHTDTVSSIFT